ncbi:hypothetical protein [Poseidonibacter antarcticus]|uniref:hypothetical protein n=1 Tax=Poseidonibacter antarcticus TaxID=2478538 RepID=UPI000EF4C8E5|nr:hypothetical protein [Poseidonibacter antarcticus]
MKEFEKYFLMDNFEEGWGVQTADCEELLIDYCIEALFIPEEKIEELTMVEGEMEIVLKDLEIDDVNDDWYVNLLKNSKGG